ncbi:MAG: hypothetical protein HOQ11_00500 [Gemmatimonadaceae bacterium]|nr:hypothetical protein [Gemmatimonadaceae bacterium]NUR19891.1 hypothetical protein [Gemmatimonadaceae bacterium]NUS95867.1 hypothetical protein [Gemmatimonadaceae bacterium]
MRRLMLLASLLALTLVVDAPVVRGQVITVPKGGLKKEPAGFVSGGIGLLAIQGVFDGTTQTGWDFSQALEYHAALEYGLGRGSSIGVTASYASVPLSYQQLVNTPNGPGVTATDAHVNVFDIGAQFALGPGSAGFHQVVVINAGVIAFENFRSDADACPASPTYVCQTGRLRPTRDLDPRLGIGYGFGYGFASRSEIYLIQEYGVALHQSTGLSGSDRRQYQQQTTKIGFRVGLGAR